jgi:hypothetical protein
MSIFKRVLITGAATVLATSAMLLGMSGSVFADCFQYNQNGFQTSSTPVFNNICGVPGVGNESDFVRIRQDVSGNDTNNNNNPAYTTGTLTSQCSSGTKYDVWNYLHNDAYSQDNSNGTGSAVAHNVVSTMTAPVGTKGTSFMFSDQVIASNAASVSDSANLNCSGNNVSLSLVPGTVNIFSAPYGSAWKNLPDATINNPLQLGSPNFGSGTMWGCWEYRMVVVYQVTVTSVTTPPTTPPSTPPSTPPTTPPSTPHTTPPSTLVNTGPGTSGIVAAFTLVTIGAGLGFRRYTLRRMSQK